MSQNKFFIIILGVLLIACGETSQEDSFGKKMDEAKKNIANTDFTVSTFAVDSAKYWNVISQITVQQKSGIQSTIINTGCRKDTKLVASVTNEIKQKALFLGQIITTSNPDSISLYYLLSDEQNKNLIFKVSCGVKGNSLLEELDSTKSTTWPAIKALIIHKHS